MANRINLGNFQKRSDGWSRLVVLGHVTLVIAPVFFAAWIGPGIFLIGFWLWCGLLMSGLLNLMHECAHFHLFREKRGSNLLGHWLLGPLLLADFEGYRQRHWKHHTNLGVDGDTKDAYLVDLHGAGLTRLLFRCLILRAALEKFKTQVGAIEQPKSERGWVARTIAVQVIFFAALCLAGGPLARREFWPNGVIAAGLAYGFVYLYGLASLTVLAATLRAIAEHQIEPGETSGTGRAALRNFQCGPLAWLIFGAYGFAEHATHHREPALEYYHLPHATEELAAAETELLPSHRYLSEIRKLARNKPRDRSN